MPSFEIVVVTPQFLLPKPPKSGFAFEYQCGRILRVDPARPCCRKRRFGNGSPLRELKVVPSHGQPFALPEVNRKGLPTRLELVQQHRIERAAGTPEPALDVAPKNRSTNRYWCRAEPQGRSADDRAHADQTSGVGSSRCSSCSMKIRSTSSRMTTFTIVSLIVTPTAGRGRRSIKLNSQALATATAPGVRTFSKTNRTISGSISGTAPRCRVEPPNTTRTP